MTDKLSQEVFEVHNKLRQNPQYAITILKNRLQYFKGTILHLPGTVAVNTKEGAASVEECIKFLEQQKPVPALIYEKGLQEAARDHAEDIGSKGMSGHEGSDHSTTKQRIERYGNWKPGTIGENISFGKSTAEDVMIQLIVDDGVPSRGHRNNTFQPDFKLVGIYSGPHKTFKNVTVLDYSKNFKPGAVQDDEPPKKEQKEKKELKQHAEPKKEVQPKQAKQQQPQQQGTTFKEQIDVDITGYKKCDTKTKTVKKGGKKYITTTKTYTMPDGSTKEVVTEKVEDD